jgi:amino acid transporter
MSKGNNKKIGVGVATVIGMNAMIGAGIVGMPAVLAGAAGPAGILSYVISVSLGLFLGLSLGHLANIKPGRAWSYYYPSLWGGHSLGMISSTCYLASVLIAMGFLVQMAGVYAHTVIPSISSQLLGVSILGILTILVLAGAQVSSWGQYIISALVLIPLVVTSFVCLTHFNPSVFSSFMPYGIKSVFETAPLTLFSFLGFESIASLYSIVDNPKENIQRAMVLAIMAVGTLYILFAASILFSIPLSYFSGGLGQALPTVLSVAFPQYRFVSTFVFVGGLFAIIGTLHSMIWSLSILFTVVITSLCMLIVSLSMLGKDILNATVFFIVPSYVFSVAYLLFIKKEWKSLRIIRTICALAGGIFMIYFASGPVVYLISKIMGFM